MHLFQLGPDARVGKERVPAALTTVPCYVYRDADARRASHLDAMAEPAVDEREGELTLAAIEGVVDRWGILHELCTDAELDVERAPAHTNGFHAGATLAQATEALVRGGFVVHLLLGAEPAEEKDPARALVALVRHLDLSSLDATFRALAPREGELPHHAAAVEAILEAALEREAPEEFAEDAVAQAAALDRELVDSLVLHAARVARRAGRDHADAARALLGALPAAVDARVQKVLKA